MPNRRSYAGWVFLLTTALIVREGYHSGLSANAQSFQPAPVNVTPAPTFWSRTTDVIAKPFHWVMSPINQFYTGFTGGLAGKTPKEQLSLCPGQRVINWPDNHKLLVDRDTHVVSTTGGPKYSALQPVSELPPTTSPERVDSSYLIKGDQSVKPFPTGRRAAKIAQKNNLCPGMVYKRVGYKYVPARASVLAPGNILLDEYGKRIQMTQKGLIAGNTVTPVSEIPDYGAGTYLVNDLELNQVPARRVYTATGMVPASKKVIIPPTTSIVTVPSGSRISAVPSTVITTPVSERVPCLSAADAIIINQFITRQSQRANFPSNQFGLLTPDQQRLVLAGQTIPYAVSGVQPIYTLPADVQSQLLVNNVLSTEHFRNFVVVLPGDLERQLSPLPTGYTRALIGKNLILLDGNNRIIDIQRNVIL